MIRVSRAIIVMQLFNQNKVELIDIISMIHKARLD